MILPVGISFYTFQSISYTIDVYRRDIEGTKNFLDLALYIGFFPQLVAGPIVRASDFLPQLLRDRLFARVDVRGNLVLFAIGFVKKAVIADNLARIVDLYFQNPYSYTWQSSWIAVLSYAIQIYCDFSGYSDMAIACAGLLGYDLCSNFNFPYFSTSVRDFWRRWHISLSTWLRDCLYIPLGGSRGTKWDTQRNLFLTMFLGGLWHGASWNFAIWGSLHGGALIVQRGFDSFRKSRKQAGSEAGSRLVCFVSAIATVYFVCICWIFFREASFSRALWISRTFVFLQSPGETQLDLWLFAVIGGLFLVHWIAYRSQRDGFWRKLSSRQFAIAYGLLFAAILPCILTQHAPFIYFDF